MNAILIQGYSVPFFTVCWSLYFLLISYFRLISQSHEKVLTVKVKTIKNLPPLHKQAPQILEGMALLEAIGNTPLLPLRRVSRDISPDVKIFAKAEWFNPGGSVKDRPAFNIIRTAVFDGKLLPGMSLLDSTSGNMGIAYATFGAALDIPVTLVVPSNASP